jgi:LysM repeat protein
MMVSRQHLFRLVALFLALSLILVACERPVPGDGSADEETTTDGGEDTATTEAGDGGSADTGDEGGTTEEPIEPTEEAGDEGTPRGDPVEGEGTEGSVDDKPVEKDETTEVTEEVAETEEMDVGDEATTDEVIPITHTVAAGENLYKIGLQYNVTWVAIAELNALDNANRITVGQILSIPSDAGTGPDSTSPALTETTYTVKANDNLFRIGLLYGISWVQLAEANGLINPNQIVVGQVLKIPVDTPGPTPQFTHQVKTGETLFLISLQYGVSWPVIAEANDISSPYVIYTGQTLVIPGG